MNDLGFYPEILHGEAGWTVSQCEPLKARVDLINREGFVPDALTDIDIAIQNHEYGHVKITDGGRGRGELFQEFQYFLEECRVNLWLRQNDINYDIAYDGFNWDTMPVPTERIKAALEWLQCATYVVLPRTTGSTVPADLKTFFARNQALLSKDDVEQLVKALNSLRRNLRKSERDRLAGELERWFGRIDPPPEKPAEMKEEYAQEREEEKERREKAEEKKAERESEAGKLKGGGTNLGRMEIHRHITRTKPGRRIAQPFGSTEVGIIPTQFGRKAIDGKLFKRQKATGAVIIDCSGSMSWDLEQLKRLIKQLPNLIIATYQGISKTTRGGNVGRLCVIAEKGRWSEPQHEPDHNWGNEVDYEALEWASKVTDGPIVWLSDGEVCGGVRMAHETARMCDALMKKREIVRIATAAEARIYFSRKPTNVYTRCSRNSAKKGRLT